MTVNLKRSARLARSLGTSLVIGLLGMEHASAARGDLLASEVVANPFDESSDLFSTALIDQGLSDFGVTGLPAAAFDVAAYRIRYETIDPFGITVNASALVTIPVLAANMRTVCLLHGTETHDERVPSRSYVEVSGDDDPEYLLLLAAFSGGGYLGVAPDYVGMGDSPGFHPYHHADSEASASVDAIRVARTLAGSLAGTLGSSLGTDLFLTGFSQGGHAALAAHREIEANPISGVTLKASAPGAGAYDLPGAQLDRLFIDPAPATPLYLAYIVHAMNEVYNLWPDLTGVFKAPYATDIPGYFDGGMTYEAVLTALSVPLDQLVFHPSADGFRTNHADLVARLEENSLTGWTPQAPVLLLAADADVDVYPGNTHAAYRRMLARGAPVRRQRVGSHLDHGAAASPALVKTRAYFDSFSATPNLDYDTWKNNEDNFFAEQIGAGESVIGSGADANGDGVGNDYCYVHGLDPTLPATARPPWFRIDPLGRLEITVIRRTNDTTLNVGAEVSSTLIGSSWSSAPADVAVGPALNMGGGFEQVTFTSLTTAGTVAQEFLRTKVMP